MSMVPVPANDKRKRAPSAKELAKIKEKELLRVQEIEAQMKKPLQAQLAKIREFIANRYRRSLKDSWLLGRRISAIHNAEHRYGAQAVQRLAECLMHDKSVLYKSMRFFRMFSKAELENLLNLKAKGSKIQMGWSHVEKILTTELEQDKKLRDQLLKSAVESGWTPDELALAVREATEPKDKVGQRRGGGRPASVPRDLRLRAQNLEKVTAVLVRNDELFYRHPQHNFVVAVQDMPPDKITPQVISSLDKGIANIEALIERLPLIKQNLTEAKELAEERMKAQAQKDGVQDAEVIAVQDEASQKEPKLLGVK